MGIPRKPQTTVIIALVVLAPLGCAVRAVEPDASGSTSTDAVTGSSAETTDGIGEEGTHEEGTHEEGGQADTDGTTDSDSTGPDPCAREPLTAPPGGLGNLGFGFAEYPDIIGTQFELADFDGDGRTDVFAVGDKQGQVFAQDCLGDLVAGIVIPLPTTWLANVQAADFDGDGDVDLMFFDGLVSELYLYWNLGDGSFADPVSTPYTGRPDVAPIQLDDDNADELFVPNWHSEEGSVVQVAATLETVTTLALPACYTANSAVGDLNGDGLDDLVATGDCNSHPDYLPLATYHNTGGDTLELSQQPFWYVGDSLSGSDVLLLDVDHDDDLDVVAATSETLVLAVNLGDGTFAEEPGLIPFESTSTQRIVPVDAGGGTLGLVIETQVGFPPDLTASLVVPNDTWDSATVSGLDLQGSVVDGTDFDNDGRTDLAVLLGTDGHLGIWVSGG